MRGEGGKQIFIKTLQGEMLLYKYHKVTNRNKQVKTKLLITSLSLLAISAYAQPSIPAGGMSTPTVRVGQQTRDLVGDRESQSQTHGVVASPSNSVGNPRIPEIQAPNGSSNSSALPESLVIPGTVELAPDYVVH